MTDESKLNIPVPDPSDKTVGAMRDAIAQLSTLVDAKMGGIQAVIAEQFRSIDKRLSERDTRFELVSKDQKDAIATALTAVIEAGRQQNIKFDVLERRVAALELALTGMTSKSTGASSFASTMLTIGSTAAAILAAFVAYYALTHK
jgi:glutamate/tyrosine decarboxylase-like PLP-dependent enzyme